MPLSAIQCRKIIQRGRELLDAGSATQAARAFRQAIAADPACSEAYHGLISALRDAGQLEQAIGAALAFTAIAPADPSAHAALSISLQAAGHTGEAQTAAARARVLEWKTLLKPAAQPDQSE